MILAGIGHLTYARETFQAQVPDWIPLSKDFTGLALAIFFVLVFPGNISQYLEHRDGFGLDTDTKRLVRLLFQPVLIFLAIYSTDALKKSQTS